MRCVTVIIPATAGARDVFVIRTAEAYHEVCELVTHLAGQRSEQREQQQHCNIYGLDTETYTQRSRDLSDTRPSTIQVANERECIIIPLLHLFGNAGGREVEEETMQEKQQALQALAHFLGDPSNVFCGMGIASDSRHLALYGLHIDRAQVLDVAPIMQPWGLRGGLEEAVYRFTTLLDAAVEQGPLSQMDAENPDGVGVPNVSYPDLAVGWKRHVFIWADWDQAPAGWATDMMSYAGIDALASYALGCVFANTLERRIVHVNPLYKPWHVRRRVTAVDIVAYTLRQVRRSILRRRAPPPTSPSTLPLDTSADALSPDTLAAQDLLQQLMQKSKPLRLFPYDERLGVLLWVLRALGSLDVIKLRHHYDTAAPTAKESDIRYCSPWRMSPQHLIEADVEWHGDQYVSPDLSSLQTSLRDCAPPPPAKPDADVLGFFGRVLPHNQGCSYTVNKLADLLLSYHPSFVTSVLPELEQTRGLALQWLIYMVQQRWLVLTTDDSTSALLQLDVDAWTPEHTQAFLRAPVHSLMRPIEPPSPQPMRPAMGSSQAHRPPLMPLHKPDTVAGPPKTHQISEAEAALAELVAPDLSRFLVEYCILSHAAATSAVQDAVVSAQHAATLHAQLRTVLSNYASTEQAAQVNWKLDQNKALWVAALGMAGLPDAFAAMRNEKRTAALRPALLKCVPPDAKQTANVFDERTVSDTLLLGLPDTLQLSDADIRSIQLLIATQLTPSRPFSKLVMAMLMSEHACLHSEPSLLVRFLMVCQALHKLALSGDVRLLPASATSPEVICKFVEASSLLYHRIADWSLTEPQTVTRGLTIADIGHMYGNLCHSLHPATEIVQNALRTKLLCDLKDSYPYMPARHLLIELAVNIFVNEGWLVPKDDKARILMLTVEADQMVVSQKALQLESLTMTSAAHLDTHPLLLAYTAHLAGMFAVADHQLKSLSNILHGLAFFGETHPAAPPGDQIRHLPAYTKWLLAEYVVWKAAVAGQLEVLVHSLNMPDASEPDDGHYSQRCKWKLRRPLTASISPQSR
ncbi:hypothetical protein RI367_001264 [Sorochytrium milnesiophthora]